MASPERNQRIHTNPVARIRLGIRAEKMVYSKVKRHYGPDLRYRLVLWDRLCSRSTRLLYRDFKRNILAYLRESETRGVSVGGDRRDPGILASGTKAYSLSR